MRVALLPSPPRLYVCARAGAKFEKLCDAVQITLNKNTVPGDRSAIR